MDLNLTLKRRSKLQIEFNVNYPLDNKQKTAAHTVDAYLFVPRTLGINSETYPSYLFYRDLQSYSELLPQRQSLHDIVAEGYGLLPHLRKCIDQSLPGNKLDTLQNFENASRAFCRILKTAINQQLQEALSDPGSETCLHTADQFMLSSSQVLSEFRELESALPDSDQHSRLQRIYLLCDEYLSLLVEESSCHLAYSLRRRSSDACDGLIIKLHDYAQRELSYRSERGYASLPNKAHHNEALVYRRNSLQTYIESAFFLTTYNKPEGRLGRELLLSLAAGIAMVIATAAAFVGHVKYDNWSTTFFLILVISYMFKDRIKALAQDYLQSRGQRFFFDFRKTIYGQTTRRPLGMQRESFGFVPTRELPQWLVKLRNYDHLVAIDNDYCGEHTILYRRRGKLYPKRLAAAFTGCDIEGIRQIINFDLSRFARKMDNSKSRVFIPDGAGYQKASGRCAYHLHLIIDFKSDTISTIQHYRLIVSLDGILRIEKIGAELPADIRSAERTS